MQSQVQRLIIIQLLFGIFPALNNKLSREFARIYMFDSGKLCEVGLHDELMEKNGKYAEMFNIQAEKYVSD